MKQKQPNRFCHRAKTVRQALKVPVAFNRSLERIAYESLAAQLPISRIAENMLGEGLNITETFYDRHLPYQQATI